MLSQAPPHSQFKQWRSSLNGCCSLRPTRDQGSEHGFAPTCHIPVLIAATKLLSDGNSTLTSHACTRAIFYRVRGSKSHETQVFGLQHFCARHLEKNLHTAPMPCSVHYLIRRSRHLHRAHRLLLPCCFLHFGYQMLLRCLADLQNNPSHISGGHRHELPESSQCGTAGSTRLVWCT